MARLSFMKDIPELSTLAFRLSCQLQNVLRANHVSYTQDKYFRELQTLKSLTDSKYMFIYYVDKSINKITTYQKSNEEKEFCSVRIEPKGNILGVVAYSKKALVVNNIKKIKEQHPSVFIDGPFRNCDMSLLCAPLIGANNECFAVIELYRKDGNTFSQSILQYVTELCFWVGIAFERTIQNIEEKNNYRFFKKILNCVIDYYAGDDSFLGCLSCIMRITKNVILARTCLFYEFHDDKPDSDVYMGISDPNTDICMEKVKTIIFKKNSIVRNVIATKTLFNGFIENDEPRIDPEIEHLVGTKIKALLCVPIVVEDKVVAIVEFINKWNDETEFVESNEKDVLLVADFLSVALYYKRSCQQLVRDTARLDCYEEILQYQLKYRALQPGLHYIQLPNIPEGFYSFSWFPDDECNLESLIYFIFLDTCEELFVQDDSNESNVDEHLKEFIKVAKILHRDNSYHNFSQSFNTVHFMYCLLKIIPVEFDALEKLGLLLASFIHCVDHSGLDNYSLAILNHPIHKMFKKAPKEHHRVDVGNFLISRSKLLDHLTEDDREKVYKISFDALTNVQYFTRNRDRFQKILQKHFDVNISKNRSLLFNFLLWCAVHSRHSKSFRIVKRLCERLYREYYYLGELEMKLDFIPLPRRDRAFVEHIPDFEVEHLEKDILPGYEILKGLFPSTEPMYDAISEICKTFKDLISIRGKNIWRPDESIGLFIEEITK